MALPFEQVPLAAGFLLALSLAAPPGPGNALMAHVAAQRGLAAGWLTGLGAVAGDLLMFTLMWVGALRVVEAVPSLKVVMGVAGAALMAFFAWEALRVAWRLSRGGGSGSGGATDAVATVPDVTARGGFARSFVTVTTSPFNWAWWLTFGAAMFARMGIGVVVGFFAGLVLWCGFWSGLARMGATRIRRFREGVAFASAVVLLVFAGVVAVFAAQTARDLWF